MWSRRTGKLALMKGWIDFPLNHVASRQVQDVSIPTEREFEAFMTEFSIKIGLQARPEFSDGLTIIYVFD